MRQCSVMSLVTCLYASTQDVVLAQPATPPSTYDTCAIRQEGSRLLRGAASVEVGHLGLWSAPRMTDLVQGSDSARTYALRFDENYNSGTRLSFLGVALSIPIFVQLAPGNRRTQSEAWLIGLAVPSLVFNIAAGFKLRRARKALSSALWWYNRDLPR